ncbi:hypothetical protein [Streptomyces fragilis]|uniref:Acyl-CoA dehydrogenase n=1 Tax=Streptomyces fragilis TaxID=67301 RepID=A0ABV2YKQ9_9ACTN|nr:hypothetical protein [Streptomyces fragilis]
MTHVHATAAPPAGTGPEDLRRYLDGLWEKEPFVHAAAWTEHLCGVLPLLDLFPDASHDPQEPRRLVEGVRTGALLAALGLFTPNTHFAPSLPAVRAERVPGLGLTLEGRFRYASPQADLSLVPLRVAGEEQLRLVLLPHTHDGLRTYGAGRATEPGWGELTGAVVQEAELSHPVTWDLDGPLVRVLDSYGWEFARRSVTWSARVIADLRRSLAATGSGTEALSTSQYLAHELSKLEIEISLAAAAASFGAELKGEEPGGQSAAAVLLAATDLLTRTARVVEDMSTELGLTPSPCAADSWPAGQIQGYFGGRRMAESQLARRMGLVPEAVAR